MAFSDNVEYINKDNKLVNIEEVEGLEDWEKIVNSIEVSQIDKNFELFGSKCDSKQAFKWATKTRYVKINKKRQKYLCWFCKGLTGCSTIDTVYLLDNIPIKNRSYRTPLPLSYP